MSKREKALRQRKLRRLRKREKENIYFRFSDVFAIIFKT